MPAGTALFANTSPTCVGPSIVNAFSCTLANAPAPEISDFLGTREVIAIDGRVAGGCIGLDHAGMTWDCYVGQDAIDHAIIGPGLLGQPAPFPGRG
jgi:hypothetical protein